MGSYVFSGSNNGDHATNTTGAPATDKPVTLAVWFRPDVNNNAGCLVSLADKDLANVGLALEARGDVAGDPVRGRMVNDTVASTTGFTPDTWHSGVAVLANGAQSVYIDGGSEGTGTFVTGVVIDSISVGRHGDSTPSNWFDGWIGYVFVWNIALTDAEVADWHAGNIPQEANLVAAYDFTADGSGTIVDQYGTLDLTVTGATYDGATSPPVDYFSGSTTKTLTPATETDTAQALSYAKPIHKTLSPATETDTAQALSVADGTQQASLTPATETDTAQALTAHKRVTIQPPALIGPPPLFDELPTDIAQALGLTKRVDLTPAAETDTAQTLSIDHPIRVTLNPALETDTAVALSRHLERLRLGRVDSGATEVNPRISGAAETSYVTGALEPAHATGALEPARVTGAAEPSYVTGAADPVYATGAAEPSHATGASEVEH